MDLAGSGGRRGNRDLVLGTNQVEDRQVAQVPVAKKTSLEAAPVDGLAQQKPASTAAGAESAGGRSGTTKGPAAASFGATPNRCRRGRPNR